MGALIAFTEGERLGLLGLIGVCITAAASVTAAVIAHRTKKENSDQHHGVHSQLSRVASSVETQSEKIDGLREDIAAVRDSAHQIARRVDHAHERIDHQSWIFPDK